MRAIVCDCPIATQTLRKLPEIIKNGAVPTQFTCVIHSWTSQLTMFDCLLFQLQSNNLFYPVCSTWRLFIPQNSSMKININVSVFLFKQLHLTLTYTQFLSVYTVLACSVFIWLMKCSSSCCIWHDVHTASLSKHSINLKCVHLAHEISHLKGKLVFNVVVLNSFDLKLFSFHSTLI